jgi:protein-L-isoaspartate O-methyltransferase
VLSRLSGSVVALDEDAELVRQAKEAMASVGATNVELVTGSLTAGLARRRAL